MSSQTAYEVQSTISLVATHNQTDQTGPSIESAFLGPGNLITTTSNSAKHRRVQFLKLSSNAETARGIPGLTPPYLPSAPSLLRATIGEDDGEVEPLSIRGSSPLRNIVLSSSPGRRIKFSHSKMPHAVTSAHSGFQAIILCGPGIGLSTFTSVPGDYPKALVNVANRPMVWYVLDWCYRMGVTDITLITPPAAQKAIDAALNQNPYLTSLPSPKPDLLAPQDLELTTPTAELLRLPEVQSIIQTDFLLLPCDLICDISGDGFLELYLTTMAGLGGVGAISGSSLDTMSPPNFSLGGEGSGRRGGLSIWYNTTNRDESVKGEECDFMGTTALDSRNDLPIPASFDSTKGTLRKLVSTMPMSELWDQIEEDKSWKLRQSLLRKHGAVKCLTQYRDSHIYFFPHWVKDFALLNEDFESVSEDLVGTWAKSEWRKPSYRARFGVKSIFAPKKWQHGENQQPKERPIEEEIDLLQFSSTQVTQYMPNSTQFNPQTAQLASRVSGPNNITITASTGSLEDGDHDADGDTSLPGVPPISAYILPSIPSAPLLRRVDTTPLLLSVSLLLAKVQSIEEATAVKAVHSPFAHVAKVAGTATVAPRVTITRSDTLIDNNSTVATQCVIKSSCVGSNVSIGQGARITGCLIMDGATIGEKCVLTGTVVGKKAKIGKGSTMNNCEVQDGNAVAENTEGKGEKYLIGGLEDDIDDEMGFDDDGDDVEGEGIEHGE